MKPYSHPRRNVGNPNNGLTNNIPMAPDMPREGEEVQLDPIAGILDIEGTDAHGVVRPSFKPSEQDAYIAPLQIKRLGLRPGDRIIGQARPIKEGERYGRLVKIESVNELKDLNNLARRPKFDQLTPIYPNEKLVLETGEQPLGNRLIDLVAPIGKGQRAMVVAPPKAGKTTIIKDVSTGLATNYPDVHLMAVLIGERPEEVTDIARHILAVTKNSRIPGETFASNFDEKAEDQTRVAEMALERARRLVELGGDVVVLLDSITRLARAYNLAIPTSGRTLSGGFDPAALYPPKRFFGAARNMENGGSLTIIGTALIDTGSRMDELIYEEFKGTGNMELVLDRKLANRRVFPAVDVQASGTRREDLLFNATDYQSVVLMRRMIDMLGENERTDVILERLKKTKTNKEFLANLKNG